jgi:hypothetical protein
MPLATGESATLEVSIVDPLGREGAAVTVTTPGAP